MCHQIISYLLVITELEKSAAHPPCQDPPARPPKLLLFSKPADSGHHGWFMMHPQVRVTVCYARTHTRKVCVRKWEPEKSSLLIWQSNLFSLFLPWSCSYWENQSISQGPGVYKHDALHSPKPLSTSYTRRGLRAESFLPTVCVSWSFTEWSLLPTAPAAVSSTLRPSNKSQAIDITSLWGATLCRPEATTKSSYGLHNFQASPSHALHSSRSPWRPVPARRLGDWSADHMTGQSPDTSSHCPLFPWNLKILDKTSHQVNASNPPTTLTPLTQLFSLGLKSPL